MGKCRWMREPDGFRWFLPECWTGVNYGGDVEYPKIPDGCTCLRLSHGMFAKADAVAQRIADETKAMKNQDEFLMVVAQALKQRVEPLFWG